MSVTILLTTKGRHLHTLRWLWHHNRIGLPFEVIVADGEVVAPVARLLDDPRSFPNLRYRYLRYDDRSRGDYFAKIVDALGRVETPYVMMSDNDDFVLPAQLERLGRFLDAAPDHVAAGGPVGNFALWTPPSSDPLHRVVGQPYTFSLDRACAFAESEPQTRVEAYFDHRIFFFYHLLRTRTAQDIQAGAQALSLYKFPMWEHYSYLSLLTLGKVGMVPGISYLRQLGTSQSHVTNREPVPDGVDERDNEVVMTAVAQRLATTAHLDRSQVEAYIRRQFAGVEATSSPGAPPSLEWLRQWARSVPPLRALKRRRRIAAMEHHLAQLGADTAYLALFRRDLAAVGETLEAPAFRAFVASRAPELLAVDGRDRRC